MAHTTETESDGIEALRIIVSVQRIPGTQFVSLSVDGWTNLFVLEENPELLPIVLDAVRDALPRFTNDLEHDSAPKGEG